MATQLYIFIKLLIIVVMTLQEVTTANFPVLNKLIMRTQKKRFDFIYSSDVIHNYYIIYIHGTTIINC